jgi:hypothetical protein
MNKNLEIEAYEQKEKFRKWAFLKLYNWTPNSITLSLK